MSEQHEDVTAVATHLPCPDCGSTDALTENTDGSTKCFSCGKFTPSSPEARKPDRVMPSLPSSRSKLLEDLTFTELAKRRLEQKTCARFGYALASCNGSIVQVAPYYKKGKLVGQKVRTASKEFWWHGKSQGVELFGQHLCKGKGRLVITEGELDAMTVSQAFLYQTDVVSIPNGAQGAVKSIQENIEFVEGYDEVVLCFDNDKPGREAMDAVVSILSPGKVKLVGFPKDIKDPSDLMQLGRGREIKPLIYDAQPYRPDGIISGASVTMHDLMQPIKRGVAYRFPLLEAKVKGARKGEITLWTAGSGIGKSTLCRELLYDYRKQGLRVGAVFLEENVNKTVQALIALDNNVPLAELRINPGVISMEDYRNSYDTLVKPDGLFLFKHFGSLECKNLMNKLRFLAVACKVDYIFLDHISIVVSGNESDNERKDIDVLMTSLRSLVESTGVGVHAVAHLKRTQNKNFNEGGQISLNDLRGSASLEQLSDNVYALERNQQAEEGSEKNKITLRVLKCREVGDTGEAGCAVYVRETGRLLPEEYVELGEEGSTPMRIEQKENNDNDEDF